MDYPNLKRSAVAGDLPEDPLAEILARVPIRSLCRSKCVAKTWRDLIEDPFHRKKLPQTLQGYFLITRDTCGPHIGYASLLARPARRQIDPSLSFLTKLPGFESLTFLDSCNGLLIFEHMEKSLGYVVCNPTTKQWGAVPRYAPPPCSSSSLMYDTPMYLVFDLAVSSHFHLVQFVWGWEELEERFVVDEELSTSVNVYSSESVTRKIIPVPIMAGTKRWPKRGCVAQSQGCLHYINKAADAQLSIWVLEDYDTQKWVLKHSVSFMELFAKLSHQQSHRGRKKDYSVVAMHPDANVIFIVQDWNQKLISYDMDHKLVSVIRTLENDTSTMHVVPYVPCFLESPALTNKH
ncbi:hypothetical protein BDA96_02G060500 [Sorghum bicolor]|uniref:F-box domain-containing protein n=1 Tax=Sorghum bicolor TaxID=4558 RepID=A0A921RKL5_SORBI|nr:hypothetical protein BDA96_02G060500 [Sorghum bicolor]